MRGQAVSAGARMASCVLVAFLSSCSSDAGRPPAVPRARSLPIAARIAAPPEAPACRRARSSKLPLPVAVEKSSSVALVTTPASTLAYVADEGDEALRVVDLARGEEVYHTPLGPTPSDVPGLGDGRVAVSLRDGAAVVVLEPADDLAAPFDVRCRVPVATEPTGMAATPDGSTILVTSRMGHALTALDGDLLEPRF